MLSDPRTRLTTVGQAIMSVYKRFRWVTIMLAAGSQVSLCGVEGMAQRVLTAAVECAGVSGPAQITGP